MRPPATTDRAARAAAPLALVVLGAALARLAGRERSVPVVAWEAQYLAVLAHPAATALDARYGLGIPTTATTVARTWP